MGRGDLQDVLGGLTRHEHADLLVGLAHSDDAAVYRITDEIAIVSTVDFFPPIVADPYLYGAIAAANSMSDVYAVGGQVLFAPNVAGFPRDGHLGLWSARARGRDGRGLRCGYRAASSGHPDAPGSAGVGGEGNVQRRDEAQPGASRAYARCARAPVARAVHWGRARGSALR